MRSSSATASERPPASSSPSRPPRGGPAGRDLAEPARVALAEARRRRPRVLHVGRERRVVGAGIDVGQIPGDALGTGLVRCGGRAHAAPSTGDRAAGSVTGARQVKRSQTYTAGSPPTSVLPSSSGTPSAGPTATTVRGWNGASAARATGASGG